MADVDEKHVRRLESLRSRPFGISVDGYGYKDHDDDDDHEDDGDNNDDNDAVGGGSDDANKE